MPEPASFSYDEMPYINRPFAQTHPGRLAAQGKLFGMSAPAVETCSVLELGCASGDNLIPMALGLPGSRFLGIDLSARQIEQGQRTIAALGLPNIELRHADIAGVDAAYGQFDYIISHGIYSWVPAPIREKLLAICRDNLVPNGVAYVSYNTLPGWGTRAMLRELMLYHSRQAQGAAERVLHARAVLDFLGRGLPRETPYGALLQQELDNLHGKPDAYLFHDHLEDVNEPVYFHQFIEAAERHGMQYLAEAEFSTMTQANLPQQVAEELHRMSPDVIAREQYLDFLHNRTFRQTLLVHRSIRIDRNPEARSVHDFQIASPVRPVSRTPSLVQGAPESFNAPNGAAVETSNALTKSALMALARQWPGSLPFAQLVATARTGLREHAGAVAGDTLASDTEFLAGEILQCNAVGAVELRVWSPRLSIAASARPNASPLARLQAARGDQITNLNHQQVALDGFDRVLLPLLDGSRERDALIAALASLAASGSLQVQQHGKPLTHGAALEKILRAALDGKLPRFAKAALLLD